jgi:hypothetical protein
LQVGSSAAILYERQRQKEFFSTNRPQFGRLRYAQSNSAERTAERYPPMGVVAFALPQMDARRMFLVQPICKESK